MQIGVIAQGDDARVFAQSLQRDACIVRTGRIGCTDGDLVVLNSYAVALFGQSGVDSSLPWQIGDGTDNVTCGDTLRLREVGVGFMFGRCDTVGRFAFVDVRIHIFAVGIRCLEPGLDASRHLVHARVWCKRAWQTHGILIASHEEEPFGVAALAHCRTAITEFVCACATGLQRLERLGRSDGMIGGLYLRLTNLVALGV